MRGACRGCGRAKRFAAFIPCAVRAAHGMRAEPYRPLRRDRFALPRAARSRRCTASRRRAPARAASGRFGLLRAASHRFAPLRTASGHDACVFGAFARLLLSCRLEYSEPGASPCFRQASASISRQRCAT
ncbi:hypothetical protein BOC39_05820 [Burkholderia pseudomallei]|nr:hypothetical protein BOC39_05820 [Burkholderia pseudomallei]ARM05022.1 hypothetical protein BOC59_36500 [Burkholderia pseudomallei]